jgi:chemotaxis protein MotA
MELTTLLGLVIGIGGIILGNYIEGGHAAALVQIAAAVIVFGGTLGAVLVSGRRSDLRLGLKMFRSAFLKSHDDDDGEKVLSEILDCSRLARKESILSIENRIAGMSDSFMQNVLRTVVDGVDPKVLRDLFERQIDIEEERLLNGAKVWSDAGGFSPTIGIIGAVLGLIHVMNNLTDTSKLGTGIAVAFVATIYGVASANLIFLPIASKLKKRISEKIRLREMVLEGGICIQSGLAPTLTEMKLRPFLEKGN